MLFYPDEKTIVMIDGLSLYSAAKAAAVTIDYKVILNYFQDETTLVRAYFYVATEEEKEHNPIKPLIDYLSYNGYMVKTRMFKETANGGRIHRPRMDVEMAVDAMELADKVDHIVLATGKGDFVSLAMALQRKGVKVSIMTIDEPKDAASSSGLSDELRRCADQIVALRDIPNCTAQRVEQA